MELIFQQLRLKIGFQQAHKWFMFPCERIPSVWTLGEHFWNFERFPLKVYCEYYPKSCRWEIMNRSRSQIPTFPAICYKCCIINIWRFQRCWFILKTLKVFASLGDDAAVDGWMATCDLTPFSSYSHSFCGLSIEILGASIFHCSIVYHFIWKSNTI